MGTTNRGWMEGPRIIAAAALVLAIVAGLGISLAGTGSDGALWLTIATARVSLTLFLITFCASAVNGLLRNRTGKWLLRNRRYLGLSFATSHVVHAFAFQWYASARASRCPTWSGPHPHRGSVGYLLLALLALTSTDAAVRWLGRSRWTALHKTGMYILYVIFVFSYLGRSMKGDPLSMISMVVLLAALGLRIAARLRRRGARKTPASR